MSYPAVPTESTILQWTVAQTQANAPLYFINIGGLDIDAVRALLYSVRQLHDGSCLQITAKQARALHQNLGLTPSSIYATTQNILTDVANFYKSKQ